MAVRRRRLVILLLLAASLRSLPRLARVVLPLAAAVLCVVAACSPPACS